MPKERTQNTFSLAVEKKAVEEDMTYLDALTDVMTECDIDPKQVAKLINRSLKEKLEVEVTEARLIKGEPEPRFE